MKSLVTFIKLSKKAFLIITILNNNHFTSSHVKHMTSINPVYTLNKKFQCLLFCQMNVGILYTNHFDLQILGQSLTLFLTWSTWMVFSTTCDHIKKKNYWVNLTLGSMGRNLIQVRDNILKKVVASTRKNSKAQTLTDKKINVSIFFLTHLTVITFIKFCFTSSFR